MNIQLPENLHVNTTREKNAIQAKNNRAKNRKKSREYQIDFQREWLKNPDNHAAHKNRTSLNNLLYFDYKKPKTLFDTENELGITREQLQELYLSSVAKYQLEKLHVSHSIGLKCFQAFGIRNPIVWNNIVNIEILPPKINNQQWQYASENSITVAYILEKIFPVECKGLGNWVSQWNDFVIEKERMETEEAYKKRQSKTQGNYQKREAKKKKAS